MADRAELPPSTEGPELSYSDPGPFRPASKTWEWGTVAKGHATPRGRRRGTAPAQAYGSEPLVTTTLQRALRAT